MDAARVCGTEIEVIYITATLFALGNSTRSSGLGPILVYPGE